LRGARIVRVRRLAGKAGGPVQRRFGQGGGPSLGGRRRRAYSARMSRQRQIHYLTWIGAILPGIVAAILVFFLWGSTRDRQLPPQGGRPVGRATFDWSDFGGPLLVIWYPAVPSRFDTATVYVPGIFADQMFHGRSPFSQRIGVVRDRAYSGAVAAAAKSYPVVMLSAAAGREPTGYAVLAEELAGRGYVVVGSSPASPDDSTPPPRRNAAERAADIRALLSDLERHRDAGEGLFARLDLRHVAFVGQGVGAEASLQACAADARCAAAVALGGPVPARSIGRPVLAVLGGGPAAAPPPGVTVVRVQGLRPLDFTDDAVLFEPFHDLVRLVGLEIDGRRALQIVGADVGAFLDHTLRGQSAALPAFPEATITAGAAR